MSRQPLNGENMKSINLQKHAHILANQVCRPVWPYEVPFNHQSISVLLPTEQERSLKDHAHAFVMSNRLAKELFVYGQMGLIAGQSHPLVRYAVAATEEVEIANGIIGTLSGIPVFSNDSLGNILLNPKHCVMRVTLAMGDDDSEFLDAKSIYVEPVYTETDIARIDEWIATEEERKARQREAIERQLQELAEQNAAKPEMIELRIPGEPAFDADPDATKIRELASEMCSLAGDIQHGDMTGEENRRTAESEKYVTLYDRYAESEFARTGSWPSVFMVSVGAAIGLMPTARVIGDNLAHAEWKDGTDSRLHLHVNDEMFEQWELDALELARYTGEIGIAIRNEKGFPYRTVDFTGVKYVSQTFKYVPGSKAKPQRVFTFSYATKVEAVL